MHRNPLWRSAPPAVFPVCLGLMGLGLGWRNADGIVPFAFEIGGLLLGLSTAYYLFFLIHYLCKFIARPGVLLEDIANPAARAGVAALAMAMMLLAASLLPFGISVPQVWWAGVILQIGASALVCHAILKDPSERRHFTPFQYLTFVGPIVGPIAGIPLGYVWQSIALCFAALAAFVVITIGLGLRLRKELPPVNLRPSLVIFLAPNCLFAVVFGMLDVNWGFQLFYWSSNIVGFCMIMLLSWLLKGGWSPAWAAFTFPLAAWLAVQHVAVERGEGMWALAGVYVGLGVATPVILFVAYRFVMLWVTGELAEKTGAATA